MLTYQILWAAISLSCFVAAGGELVELVRGK